LDRIAGIGFQSPLLFPHQQRRMEGDRIKSRALLQRREKRLCIERPARIIIIKNKRRPRFGSIVGDLT
jgi:hypothetical protein